MIPATASQAPYNLDGLLMKGCLARSVPYAPPNLAGSKRTLVPISTPQSTPMPNDTPPITAGGNHGRENEGRGTRYEAVSGKVSLLI
uniref:Uncharacterized protein n=1 Tax=Sinorhizobium sp. M14 TaxID=430451 RepID=A0A142BPA6_9HYPH|nr:hypothetical protein pSinB_048 [Sinorhizobium sp. M14]